MIKESDEILRSDRRYIKIVAVVILCIWKIFHSGILKFFEGNLPQGIKLHIIYFSFTDIIITTVIMLFSIHLLSIDACKSSSDEPLWCL